MHLTKLIYVSTLISLVLVFSGCNVEQVIGNLSTPLIGESFNVTIHNKDDDINIEADLVSIGVIKSRSKQGDETVYNPTTAIKIEIDGNEMYCDRKAVTILDKSLKIIDRDDTKHIADSTKSTKVSLYDTENNQIGFIEGSTIKVERTESLNEVTRIVIDGKSCYLYNVGYTIINNNTI